MTTLTRSAPVAPLSEKEAALARESGDAIVDFLAGEDQSLTLNLARADGQRLEAVVPGSALRLLARVLGEMASGRPVTLIPQGAELTTHQAADLLGVSRPHLIKQLEAGKIPYRKVGSHRRIRYEDLMAYQEKEREERHRGLDELVALSEELGLYEEKSSEAAAEQQLTSPHRSSSSGIDLSSKKRRT